MVRLEQLVFFLLVLPSGLETFISRKSSSSSDGSMISSLFAELTPGNFRNCGTKAGERFSSVSSESDKTELVTLLHWF